MALYETATKVDYDNMDAVPPNPEVVRAAINDLFATTPEVVVGHRWSAGISNALGPLSNVLSSDYYNGLSHVDSSLKFAACGDYLPENERLLSSIEGATLSGWDVANRIIDYYYPPQPKEPQPQQELPQPDETLSM